MSLIDSGAFKTVSYTHLATGLGDEGLRLTSGGTDNHLVLVDVHPYGVTGKAAEIALDLSLIHT